MRTFFNRATCLLAAGILSVCQVSAQAEMQLSEHFGRGVELYHAQKYGSAQAEFEKAAQWAGIDDGRYTLQLHYYMAMCAAELGEKNAEERLNAFLQEHPNSIYNNDVRFALGGCLYGRGEWKAAGNAWLGVNPDELSATRQEEYYYKSAHTLFMMDNYDKAYSDFRQVNPKGEYGVHALYFLSYIDYTRQNYPAAKEGFLKLQSNEAYRRLVPYYLLHIEFSQGNYRYVTEHGDALMTGATLPRSTEMARLLAESWFHLNDYDRTLDYMDKYRAMEGKMGREELYIEGFAAYREAYYQRAAQALEQMAAGDDALAQHASYCLGGAYLKTGDKARAMQSFMLASAARHDEQIREDALFNYGKLQYELGGGAFNDAINVLERYLKEYPDSPRANEARQYLVAAYYNSHDYAAAWEAIRKIPNPDNNIRTAYQKIAYFRGLECFKAGDYSQAMSLLDLSLANRFNPKYTALTNFWRAEILIRQGQYEKAIPLFRDYIRLSPATEPEHAMAHYNLGYTYFNLKRWNDAREWFHKFLAQYPARDSYRADTYNRLGDMFFAERSYKKAIECYDNAIKVGSGERYYAHYQRAVMLGLSGNSTGKTNTLQEIITAGEGDYVGDAMYELGRTHIAAQRYQDGATMLKRYVERFSGGAHHLSALADLGLVYENLGDNQQALGYYKSVVEKAPASPQAKDAMLAIRGIYVGTNDVDTYFAFAQRSGMEIDLSLLQRDSLAYAGAERVYLSGDAQRAVSALQGYLSSYSKGRFRAHALYYLAESSLRSGNRAGAIGSLEELSGIYQNEFTVRGLERLSTLTYEEKDYAAAAKAYRQLSQTAVAPATVAAALSGYMRSVVAQGEPEATLQAADEVLASPHADSDVTRQAYFAKAKALERQNRPDEALSIYRTLSVEGCTPEGAEATCRVIEASFKAGDTAGAEKLIYALSEQRSTQSYWVAKSFLILGDIFARAGDSFQARATYQSVVEGYSPADDGIVAEARKRIEALK